MCAETAFEWDVITDLPPQWSDLRRDDLHLVHRQWSEEKRILKDPAKIQKLEERLSTEWAIETGIIERLYTLDRGITETLIELGLEALHQLHGNGRIPQDALRLIEDQRETLEFVFEFVKQERELSLSYIKELHQLLTRHQETSEGVDQFGRRVRVPLIRGSWKQLPNNPTLPDGRVHEYCPPDFVQDEMDQLIKWHDEHKIQGVDVEIEAAWLHHRFTQIHPFQDGNGRVARALATIVFLRADYLPLVVRDTEHRERYLDALDRADHGDLSSLVNLFADIQIGDLTNAIKTLRELRGEGLTRIATSAAERVRLRQMQTEEEERNLTNNLVDIAETRLEEVRKELELSFRNEGVAIDADVFRYAPSSATWWSFQIIETAKHHGYFADLSRFRAWVQLRLRLPQVEGTQTSIVVSFHHKGNVPGLMVATAFVTASLSAGSDAESAESGSLGQFETEAAAPEVFTYSTSHKNPEERFRQWLDTTIETGLDRWQARL